MYVSYEGDKKALFLFHCGLLLFCMTDDDGDWRGQIRLFPYFPLKCLTFSLLSLSFTSSSLRYRPKGACRLWIRQGPHLTPAASGLGNQTSSGCVSGSPSLYLFSYIWFDKSGTILRRAGLSMRMCERITISLFVFLHLV